MTEEEKYVKAYDIFNPCLSRRLKSLEKYGFKFSHYTSVAVFMSIIENEQIWLRNARLMNDFKEVEIGIDYLAQCYDEQGHILLDTLNQISPTLAKNLESNFNRWIPHIEAETYISCLSEHSRHESKLGRLSMWRGYGKEGAVALIINKKPFFQNDQGININVYPVSYFTFKEFSKEFSKLVLGIKKHIAFLKTFEPAMIEAYLFHSFTAMAVSTKHKGFKEEREWRIVYSPEMYSNPLIEKEWFGNFKGVGQNIYKLPLKNLRKYKYSATIKQLLNHVIIGPCENQKSVHKQIYEALKCYGFKKPEKLIVTSDIPYRHLD